jgi:hypothetical protein
MEADYIYGRFLRNIEEKNVVLIRYFASSAPHVLGEDRIGYLYQRPSPHAYVMNSCDCENDGLFRYNETVTEYLGLTSSYHLGSTSSLSSSLV